MHQTLLVHIVAGGLGLIAGFVALSAAKGGKLHRKSGMLFVLAMVAMALTGAGIAALRGVEGSVVGGVLAAYLVLTALTTVRPFPGSRWLDIGAMLAAVMIGLASITWGLETVAAGSGQRDGIPAPVFFMFGTVALLAGTSDVRVIRAGGLRGAPRLARHLWRMCFALWIASASFFLGQTDRIPEPLRIPALLAVPVLAPLLAMLYWLWRLRIRTGSRLSPLRIPIPERT